MKIISHRGNLEGPSESSENSPERIEKSIESGFECELDLRMLSGKLFLGHDKPEYEISLAWLVDLSSKIWIHCKDFEALNFVSQTNLGFNFFWHETDQHTITSRGIFWNYPGAPISSNAIAVLPEIWWRQKEHQSLSLAMGVCTDFPLQFRDMLEPD